MSTSSASTKSFHDDTRLGEHSAVQPLSGRTNVEETFAVLGTGRGGYARDEKAKQVE